MGIWRRFTQHTCIKVEGVGTDRLPGLAHNFHSTTGTGLELMTGISTRRDFLVIPAYSSIS
jgi:hypothetical protein